MLFKNKIAFLFIILSILSIDISKAQLQKIGFHFKSEGKKKVSVDFKQYNNLVIIPLVLNKIDTLNFALDTGAGHILITDPNIANALKLKNYRDVTVAGPSGGVTLEAYVSLIPKMRLGKKIQVLHQQVVILKQAIPYLSETAGIKIHGLIGYDIFNAFTIKINYHTKKITFYNKDKFQPKKKWKNFDIKIEQRKPYIQAEAVISEKSQTIPVKLLMDIGAGHSLSLDMGTHPNIQIPDKNLAVDLGTTISGAITGNIARIEQFNLGNFKFKRVITSFPDSISLKYLRDNTGRQGNLGCGVLQRFHIIFDYFNKKVYLKPNHKFKAPFRDNTSGISIITDYSNFKDFLIAEVRENSPADNVGLKKGDKIFSINGEILRGKNIGEVYNMLNKKSGEKVSVVLIRQGEGLIVTKLKLREMI